MELVVDRICQELSLPRARVAAAVALLNEGLKAYEAHEEQMATAKPL